MKLFFRKFIAFISISGILFQGFFPVAFAQSLFDQKLSDIQAQVNTVKTQAQSQISDAQNVASSQSVASNLPSTATTPSINDVLTKVQAIKDQMQQKTEDVSLNAQNTISDQTTQLKNETQTKKEDILDAVENKTETSNENAQTPPSTLPQSQSSKYTGADGDVTLNTGQISTENQISNNVSFNKAQAMLEKMQNSYDQITVVTNDNENNINNKMETFATSGKNIIERNDGMAEILSGRVVINASALTKNNTNDISTPAQGDDVSNQVNNKNKSLVENYVELVGDSGLNKINTNDGHAKIDTGAVDIRLNLLNLTNTNIINSEWGQLFYQSFDPLYSDFDLAKGWKQAARNDCSLGACEGEFRVTNVNEAILNNKIKILGNSGANEIIDSDGDGIIRTGDVKVSANLINFLNTNMTRSKWRLAVLNIFDDWKGDLILPGADRFDDNENDYNLFPNSKITAENDTNIKNSVVIETNTGNNEIVSADGKFNIKTGVSVAKSNVSTVGNITFTGGDWYLVFINTFGGWRGYAVNIPEDIGMAQTEQGVVFSSLLSKAILGDLKKVKNDDGKLELMTENVAELNNELLIQALTGNNKIQGVDGNAEIQTGNSLVLSNIFNFVNTTMYGGKWNLALINVFGNWEGNITFGRPNLRLTSVTQSPAEELKAGDAFTNKLIYENSGTADATGIQLQSNFDPKLFRVIASSSGAVIDQNLGKITWNIDKLKRGGTGEASFTLQAIAKTPGAFNTKITSVISAKEREWDLRDNSIDTSIKVKITENDISQPIPSQLPVNQNPSTNNQQSNSNNSQSNSNAPNQASNSTTQTSSNSTSQTLSSGGYYNSSSSAITPQQPEVPKVTIEKTNDAKGVLAPNDLVNYSIILKNTSNINTNEIIVKDTFKDPNGKIISEDEYPIISLGAKEGTVIQYSIAINPAMPSGRYINTATAYIKDKSGKVISNISSSSVIDVTNPIVNKTSTPQDKILSNKSPADQSESLETKNLKENIAKQDNSFLSAATQIFALNKKALANSKPTLLKKTQTQITSSSKELAFRATPPTLTSYKTKQNPIFNFINVGSNFLDDLSTHIPSLALLFGIWQFIANIHRMIYTSRRKL